MKARWLISLLALLGLTGCVTDYDLQTASSGQVGCKATDIVITDRQEGNMTESWTATCGSRVFICSRTESYTQGYNGGLMVSGMGNVSCAPEGYQQAPAVAAAPPPPPPKVDAPLPTQAVGFHFNSPRASVQSACQSAGHEWSQKNGRDFCSGTPQDTGLPTSAFMAYCADKLCELTAYVEFSAGASGEEQFMNLWKALRNQYGKPTKEQKNKPSSCSTGFLECVRSGEGMWGAEWKWRGGQRIVARTDTKGGTARLAIRYMMGDPDSVGPTPGQPVNGSAF